MLNAGEANAQAQTQPKIIDRPIYNIDPNQAKTSLLARLTKNATDGDPASQVALARFLFANSDIGTTAYAFAIGWLAKAIDQNYAPARKLAHYRGLPVPLHKSAPTPLKANDLRDAKSGDIPDSLTPPSDYRPPAPRQPYMVILVPVDGNLEAARMSILKNRQLAGFLIANSDQGVIRLGPYYGLKPAMTAIEDAADLYPLVSKISTP